MSAVKIREAAGGPESCEVVVAMVGDKIADLERRVAYLLAMRDALTELVQTCAQPGAQRDCPLLREIERDPGGNGQGRGDAR